MDIIGKRKIWYIISLVVIGIGLLFLIFSGLNFGIDFTGGTILQFQFDESVTNEEAREILEEKGIKEGNKIQQSSEDGVEGIMIRTISLNSDEISEIEEAFKEKFSSADLVQTRMVGPLIGQELRTMALLALLVASIAIVIYISIRFEFRFAIVAIIALLHDVLITIGIFAILGREINTPFVAALLTIIGYSINDTIVIFDRIRENMKLMANSSFMELANQAVVDTLPRSINTSITTLIAILSIYFFGGASIKVFMLALFIGMFAGTYSSIFIASPLLVTWKNKIGVS
ncbi:MAG: protein translocase subunit SecF [Halanaerobiales bacterium]